MPQSFIRAASRAAVYLACVCAATAADAATVTVPAGGDLQGALNAAQPGDAIVLEPGAVYTGNFTLPVKPGATFITIRSGGAGLPAPGTRVGPDDASRLAKIKSPNGAAALSVADGAHHWRFETVEFQANVGGSGEIISLGSGTQGLLSQLAHDLVFDRVYVHGDPVAGQKRGIALNCGYAEVRNSYISDIKAVGVDSQAIAGWNGSGPFVIENNYLEAAGENVMFGGADPAIGELVPADITVRRNVLSKPVSWRGEKWSVKNIFELKNARRVLVEGNLLENIWKAGQAGFAVQFTPRNQGGKASWSTVEDVIFRFNVIRHAGSAINISGFDDNKTSQQASRIQIANNVVYDVDGGKWGGSGIFVQIGNAPRDLVIERNSVFATGTVLNVYGTKAGAPWVIDRLAFRDNLARHNSYGVKGDGLAVGQATLAAYFSGLVFERNVLAGGDAGKYPAGNYFPTVGEFEAQFVDPSAGDLTLKVGSSFRAWATDGGMLGADVVRLTSVRTGTPTTVAPPVVSTQAPTAAGSAATGSAATGSTATGSAVCRPGSACAAVDPYALTRYRR